MKFTKDDGKKKEHNSVDIGDSLAILSHQIYASDATDLISFGSVVIPSTRVTVVR